MTGISNISSSVVRKDGQGTESYDKSDRGGKYASQLALPEDVLLLIFWFVDAQDVLVCRQVKFSIQTQRVPSYPGLM